MRGSGRPLSAPGSDVDGLRQGRTSRTAEADAFPKALDEALSVVLAEAGRPDGDAGRAGGGGEFRDAEPDEGDPSRVYGPATFGEALLTQSGAVLIGADAPGAYVAPVEVGADEPKASENALPASRFLGRAPGAQLVSMAWRSGGNPPAGRAAAAAVGSRAGVHRPKRAESMPVAGLAGRKFEWREQQTDETANGAASADAGLDGVGLDWLRTSGATVASASRSKLWTSGAKAAAAGVSWHLTSGARTATAEEPRLRTARVRTGAAEDPQVRSAGSPSAAAEETQVRKAGLTAAAVGPQLPTAGAPTATVEGPQALSAESPTAAAEVPQTWTTEAPAAAEGSSHPWAAKAQAISPDEIGLAAFAGPRADAGWTEPKTEGLNPVFEDPAQARQSGPDRSAGRTGGQASGREFRHQVLPPAGKASRVEDGGLVQTSEALMGVPKAGMAVQPGLPEIKTMSASSPESVPPETRDAQWGGPAEPAQAEQTLWPQASREFQAAKGQTSGLADLRGPAGFAGASQIQDVQVTEIATQARSEGARSVPDDANHESIPVQIVRRAAVELGPRGGRVTVSLVPEHLGRVELEVMVRDGKLNASLTAANPEVRHRLETDIGTLRESLQNLGLNVAEIRVSGAWEPSESGTGSGTPGRESGTEGQPGTGGWNFGGQRSFDQGAQRPWEFDVSLAGGGHGRGDGHGTSPYDAVWIQGQRYAVHGQHRRATQARPASSQIAPVSARGVGPMIRRIDVVV